MKVSLISKDCHTKCKFTFCCVAMVAVNLPKMSCSPKGYRTCWKPSLHWCTFCSYKVHDRVDVFPRLPIILQVCFWVPEGRDTRAGLVFIGSPWLSSIWQGIKLLLQGYYQFCKLTLYWVAFVSRLGCAKLVFARILCSTRVCMIYVHGRHVWVREAGAWQQVILRAIMCSRSSAVPGCGVFTA